MSDLRLARSSPAGPLVWLRRAWPYALAVVVVVIVAAWVDGGERPLRPISETLDLSSASEGQTS